MTETDEEILIWRMAEAHQNALGGMSLRKMSNGAREAHYDAMHIALRQLIATPAMARAALRPITSRERAAGVVVPDFHSSGAALATMAQQFAAMMDRLLHIEDGNHAEQRR